MLPKISIVIPIYMVEKELPGCLKSVEAQTYENLEIILVDDGSSDSSGVLCDEYARKHPDTRVIHQENGGLSIARNNGVKISTGEYIAFIDSDDRVSPDYASYLMGLIQEFDAEISVADFQFTWSLSGNLRQSAKAEKRLCFSTEEALKDMCYHQHFFDVAWGKLYKRELVINYPYPPGKLYEDIATTYKLVGAAHKIAYGSKAVYLYYQRPASIIHQELTQKHWEGLSITAEIIDYMREHYPGAIEAAECRYAMKALGYLPQLFNSKVEKRTNFLRLRGLLKPYVWTMLKSKGVHLSPKIKSVSVMLGYPAAYAVTVTIDNIKRIKADSLLSECASEKRRKQI